MTRNTDRTIKVEAITGEQYYEYTQVPEPETRTHPDGLTAWLANQINSHYQRLEALRVYDGSRP